MRGFESTKRGKGIVDVSAMHSDDDDEDADTSGGERSSSGDDADGGAAPEDEEEAAEAAAPITVGMSREDVLARLKARTKRSPGRKGPGGMRRRVKNKGKTGDNKGGKKGKKAKARPKPQPSKPQPNADAKSGDAFRRLGTEGAGRRETKSKIFFLADFKNSQIIFLSGLQKRVRKIFSTAFKNVLRKFS